MKTFIISGASSGIGKAIAKQLLEQNYQVIGLARTHSIIHANYTPISIDFNQPAAAEKTLKSLAKNTKQLDGIICSAGVGFFHELEQFSLATITELMNVNLLGQILLVKQFLPLLKQQQAGKIIMLGSECALQGYKKASIYAATKFGLRGFCQSIRKECANKHIAVTLINPGLVDTSFFDNLTFKPGSDPNNAIQPATIAQLITSVLELPATCVAEEINIQPMTAQVQQQPQA